jgi:hypothetical protein
MNARSKLLIVSMGFILSACSSAKEQLGLNKSAPDEFQVVKHAPLSMPPGYELRPPTPGAPRPQEQTPKDQARDSVFGESAAQNKPVNANVTGAEDALLQKAGAGASAPDIRHTVDVEAAEAGESDQAVIDKLMNLSGIKEPAARVVDPKEESRRIQKNKELDQPITTGETPSRNR